jgi:hypothetical protein
MEWTRRRVFVISVLAFAIALAITSLATGVSLRSMVKKEVAKQISKATGPAGAPGAQGGQGLQGVPGPTVGDIEGTDPPGTAESLGAIPATNLNTVQLPVAGRLLVMGNYHPGITVSCSSPAAIQFGLYVDGVAVPATLSTSAHATVEPVHIVGVSAPVAAGSHQVQLGISCIGAPTPNSVTYPQDRSIGAVLLGS